MNLKEIRDSYIDDGMGFDAATARTCRDVVLTLIAASPMASHVTVKGGKRAETYGWRAMVSVAHAHGESREPIHSRGRDPCARRGRRLGVTPKTTSRLWSD